MPFGTLRIAKPLATIIMKNLTFILLFFYLPTFIKAQSTFYCDIEKQSLSLRIPLDEKGEIIEKKTENNKPPAALLNASGKALITIDKNHSILTLTCNKNEKHSWLIKQKEKFDLGYGDEIYCLRAIDRDSLWVSVVIYPFYKKLEFQFNSEDLLTFKYDTTDFKRDDSYKESEIKEPEFENTIVKSEENDLNEQMFETEISHFEKEDLEDSNNTIPYFLIGLSLLLIILWKWKKSS